MKKDLETKLNGIPVAVGECLDDHIDSSNLKNDVLDCVCEKLSIDLDMDLLDMEDMINIFDDAFYNTLEGTNEYQCFISNLDSSEYNNDELKMELNIDVILAAMLDLDLSLSEMDEGLKNQEILLFDNLDDLALEYIKETTIDDVNLIDKEKAIKLDKQNEYDTLFECIIAADKRISTFGFGLYIFKK